MPAHFFFIEDLTSFITNLESRGYLREKPNSWVEYSKTLSGALVKYYAYSNSHGERINGPYLVRVSYQLIKEGAPFRRLVAQLKQLNLAYRKTLPVWKTKRPARKEIRDRHWHRLLHFLQEHAELVGCFRYEADDRLTEGNFSFNLQVASNPQEQALCLEFIKALADAHTPSGIIRRRREADRPVQQRNGWIKRYADIHRKRGWTPMEIAQEIQKELRNGTWNERSRLQYNIANNTICKIAGIKISRPSYN